MWGGSGSYDGHKGTSAGTGIGTGTGTSAGIGTLLALVLALGTTGRENRVSGLDGWLPRTRFGHFFCTGNDPGNRRANEI